MRVVISSSNAISVFRFRVEKKELTGVDAEQLTEFVVQSRAEATMKQYSVALKRVWFYGQKTERTVFRWGEGEVCAF